MTENKNSNSKREDTVDLRKPSPVVTPVKSGIGMNSNMGGGDRAAIWLDLATIIGVFLVADVGTSFLYLLFDATTGAHSEFISFLAYFLKFAITILFALWLRKKRGAPEPLLKISWKKTNPGLVLWGFVLVIVASVVLEPLLEIFPQEGMELLYEAIGIGGWAVMTSVVLAPILEEILFRGIIQQSLTERFGGWRGVLLASGVFAVIHIIPQQMVNAFVIGIILGYIYIKTKSILPVILIHALNNAMAFIQMKIFGTESLVTVRQLIGNDVLYGIIYGIFCAVLIVAMVKLGRQLAAIPAEETGKDESSLP